jgi:hypothetical protein
MANPQALAELRAKYPKPHAWHQLGDTSFDFRVKRMDLYGQIVLMDDWRPCKPHPDTLRPHLDQLDNIRAEICMLLSLEEEATTQ